jgi:hypothetical protein
MCGLIILKGEKKRLKSGCIEAILEYKAIIIIIKKNQKKRKEIMVLLTKWSMPTKIFNFHE